ncbi:MAG: hypothetical protein LH702_23725 [Phormidesmis sp. CAN_BIN44]|nr:hypothetical protein [Phormidesmis sp. CAN_BIN44]
MTYSDRLKHWAIVRLLPKMQRVVIERFRRRADADGHLQFLQQRIPTATFIVVFDVTIASDPIQKDI